MYALINKHYAFYHNQQEDKCSTEDQLKHLTVADIIFLH